MTGSVPLSTVAKQVQWGEYYGQRMSRAMAICSSIIDCNWAYFGHNYVMARPPKDPSLIKAEMLRIPVSAAEKAFITDAAIAQDGEFARWARAILLRAATEYHGQSVLHANGRAKYS